MQTSAPRYYVLFAAALIAGATYWLWAPPRAVDPVMHIGWKGSAVALLALWAALNARDRDGWQLAAVLALGALGDVLLETSQIAGGAAFFAGHIVAVALYWRHRRATRSPSQTLLAALLLVGTPLIAFLFTADPKIALYALGVGAMAGSAWASNFPRYRVGIGAVWFVASDLLIFAKMGLLAASPVPGMLIWPLYLGGQALIAWGAVSTLWRWKADEEVHHRL